jgi:dihydroxyacetone kinase
MPHQTQAPACINPKPLPAGPLPAHPLPRQHAVERVHAGACVTSLDMAGVSLTLMALDARRAAALDAPTSAPGWPAAGGAAPRSGKPPLPLPAPVRELRRRREALLAGRPLASTSPEGRTVEAAVR